MSFGAERAAAHQDAEPAIRVPSPLLSVLAVLGALVMSSALAVGAYFLFRNPSGLYESERQRVVEQIEQFHEQHGRYPKSLDEAGIVLGRGLDLSYYEADEGFFLIELCRGRHFPRGRTTWSYDSQKGRWGCFTEPY
jgi:hypothetical protein